MKILNNKLKILKLSIILLISITIIIILNSNIKLFQSDDYIFLKIFQKTNNENKIDYNKKESEENYIFKVDLKNIDIKQIDLMKTVDKNTCLNKKIAPGTSGNFNILLDTNKDSKYKIYFQSVNEKPQNLYFKAIKDGKEIAKTQTLEELSEKLDGNIVKKEKIKINIQWYWNFENNKANSDIQDTEDSKKIKR